MTITGIYEVEGHRDVHLIEMTIDEPPEKVDVGQITQEIPLKDRLDWQSPWEERYLNAVGDKIIGEWMDIPTNESKTRMAFFFHYLDFNRPLKTQFGQIKLTNPTVMPERLRRIIKYEKPD